tara:strand:- start:18456 stop:19217 length:762 start_codon:yes stop_codon:yes gene_type:complete
MNISIEDIIKPLKEELNSQVNSRGIIYALSGAQSTGKTTLLNEIIKGPDLRCYKEITREVKNKANLKINESACSKTQDFINASHLSRCVEIVKDSLSGKDVVMDRCALDGSIYSKYLLDQSLKGFTNFIKYNIGKIDEMFGEIVTEIDFVERFRKSYKAALLLEPICNSCVDVIFYTCPDDIEIEDDGTRSINKKFRDGIINEFEDSLDHRKNNSPDLKDNDPFIVYLTGSVEERLETIKETISVLKGHMIMK